jgi:uncharacterized cupin superfamily protein
MAPDAAEGIDRRALSDRLGTTSVAIVRYRLAPGEALPGGLHAHRDQEEVFVVISGTATFETLAEPGDRSAGGGWTGREVDVGAGEAIRFAPGEFQSGRNAADEDDTDDGPDDDLVVLAIGAPRETDDVRVPLDCPACGHGELRVETGGDGGDGDSDGESDENENEDEDGLALDCPACGAGHVPAACPDYGHADLRATLDLDADGAVVVACRDCGGVFDEPPLRN